MITKARDLKVGQVVLLTGEDREMDGRRFDVKAVEKNYAKLQVEGESGRWAGRRLAEFWREDDFEVVA